MAKCPKTVYATYTEAARARSIAMKQHDLHLTTFRCADCGELHNGKAKTAAEHVARRLAARQGKL